MKRNLTCIVCPKGCSINVEFEGNNIISISGNTCKRGEEYARNECTNPVRTITSTIYTKKGVLPVKSNGGIPKKYMFDCIKIINNYEAVLPIHIGDVIIRNILNTGVDIVSTQNMEG